MRRVSTFTACPGPRCSPSPTIGISSRLRWRGLAPGLREILREQRDIATIDAHPSAGLQLGQRARDRFDLQCEEVAHLRARHAQGEARSTASELRVPARLVLK